MRNVDIKPSKKKEHSLVWFVGLLNYWLRNVENLEPFSGLSLTIYNVGGRKSVSQLMGCKLNLCKVA